MAKHTPHPETTPPDQNRPSAEKTGSTDELSPVFCLHHLADGWRISDCERDDQAAFALTTEKLSRVTWWDIRNAHRHGVGAEKISRHALKAPVPAGIDDDVQFLALRIQREEADGGLPEQPDLPRGLVRFEVLAVRPLSRPPLAPSGPSGVPFAIP